MRTQRSPRSRLIDYYCYERYTILHIVTSRISITTYPAAVYCVVAATNHFTPSTLDKIPVTLLSVRDLNEFEYLV